jgi:hypothetical protein
MSDTTEIEKKSLEAHVELCAERYKLLETKLGTVEQGVRHANSLIEDLAETVSKSSEKSNDRLIAWGVGIIVTLSGACGWLLTNYLNK